jgi:S1-C subfamily serine protease
MTKKMLVRAARKQAKEFMKKQNVIGVGAGRKWKDGHATDQEAVVVLVKKKVAKAQLTQDDLLPKEVEYNRSKIQVDVIEVGKIHALNEHQFNHRPMMAGISCGHFSITAGTLGLFVEKDGKPYILSNNHVMADSNKAKIGDPIYQPGPYDGGRSRHTVAHLSEFPVISFAARNKVDAALAEVVGYDAPAEEPPVVVEDPKPEKRNFLQKIWDAIVSFFRFIFRNPQKEVEPLPPIADEPPMTPSEAVAFSNTMLNFPMPITGNLAEVDVGDRVQKSGRTTGYTTGEILAEGATVEVEFDAGQVAIFEDQIIADNMSAGGDSGSVVFNMNGDAIGLLFAGSDTVTILNPIQTVFAELGITRIWR